MSTETLLFYGRWLLNLLEFLSCIFGFAYWHKLKHTNWKWFPFFLAVITVGELVGKWLRIRDLDIYHQGLYQYFLIPLQFLFYYQVFHGYFKPGWQKKLAGASPVIFLACWLTEILYKEEFKQWFISVSYALGCLLLLLLLLVYIFKFIGTSEILTFKTNIMFWVVTGLFAGYICTCPYYIWRSYLIKFEPQQADLIRIALFITVLLNCVMYLFFLLGLIKWKPQT